MWRGQLDVKPI